MSGPHLIGSGGSSIPVWGTTQQSLCFGGKLFTFDFLLASVSYPILRLDFLSAHCLMLDATAGRVVDAASGQPVDVNFPATPAPVELHLLLLGLYHSESGLAKNKWVCGVPPP